MLRFPVPLVVALHGSLVHPLGGCCLLGSMECLHSGERPCLLVAIAGVSEDHNGLCAMISKALVLPDLITFLVAVTSLVVGLPGWWLA